MRDVLAGLVALALLFVAAVLATTLREYRRRHQRVREAARAGGRAIVAEIPAEDDFVLFAEDEARFYCGARAIDKDLIAAVRLLVNGAPIADYVSRRLDWRVAAPPTRFEGHVEAGAHDRWDVAIETPDGTTLVECGAIREGVSQELARAVFDAVKRDLARRDKSDHKHENNHRGTENTEQ